MIVLTSFPTYPTSVYLVASTRMKGDSVSFASLRAISVLPEPVGPLINRFLGIISSLISPFNSLRLHLFLKAQAIAFLASLCPMMNLSKY